MTYMEREFYKQDFKTVLNLEKLPNNQLDMLYQMIAEEILVRRGVKMPDIKELYKQVTDLIDINETKDT